MSLQSRIVGVVQAIGLDIKSILSSLSSLTSTLNGKNQSVEVTGPGAVTITNPSALHFTGVGVSVAESLPDQLTVTIAGGGSGLTYTGIKVANYTALAGEVVRTNTSIVGGGITVTLPTSPSDGDVVTIFDVSGSCHINPVMVVPVASTVEGDATGLTINLSGAYIALVYSSVLDDWKIADTYAGAFTVQSEPLSPFLLMGA